MALAACVGCETDANHWIYLTTQVQNIVVGHGNRPQNVLCFLGTLTV